MSSDAALSHASAFAAVPALGPGAHVRVIAPASPFPREPFDAGVARLRARYRVTFDEGIFTRDGYLAGPDTRRVGELRRALTEDGIDAVVGARGGYGTTRLLGQIEPSEVRPRLLVGFSDLSALHALFARAGLRSLHASMVAALGSGSEAAFDAWVSAVEGEPPGGLEGLETIAPGRAQGPLVGGNLSVLCALVGTPHAPPLRGSILFLEDVGEAPYRVDRMLTTLRQSGWLERVAGVAIGQFTRCQPAKDGREVASVLRERLRDLRVPVVSGVPSGHDEQNLALPLGARTHLDADGGTLSFEGGAVVAQS